MGSEMVRTAERLERLLEYIVARLHTPGTPKGTLALYALRYRVWRELARRRAP